MLSQDRQTFYQTPVPSEPISLGFDPKTANVALVRQVFQCNVARSLWLMVKYRRMTDQHFDQWCLDRAGEIKKEMPETAQELFRVVSRGRPGRGLGAPMLSERFEECERFLERLLLAIKGEVPVIYKVVGG